MLLNLLKPDIRLSFHKQQQEFPVPEPYDKFIGAGINLRRSGISDFGQRPIVVDGIEPDEISPLFFGDFLNYWLVLDIFKSIECLSTSQELASEIGIDITPDKLDHFSEEICQDDCWYGYLDGIESFTELKKCLSNRITKYRSYLNFNSHKLDQAFSETKTEVGVPIIKTVQKLKELEIVNEDVEFYVRLDQYEDLERLNTPDSQLGTKYQEIVHKLLGMRDYSVSYKIGTRDFAWTKKNKVIFGMTATLERKRDYNEVSIEEIFKRSENRRTLFPKFSEDILRRRLQFAGYDVLANIKNTSRYIFGSSLSPLDRINQFYIRSESSREKVVHLDPHWPADWNDFCRNLSMENILSAKLAEAWARQKGKEEITRNIPEKDYPWENKKWWKKERIEQALMQIASRNSQRLHWSGHEDIIDLSGASILAFIYLCKYIWDAWLKDNRYNVETDKSPLLNREIQSIGIEKASQYWFEDITQESGGRQKEEIYTVRW